MKRAIVILIILMELVLIGFSQKPLRSTRYNFKQLQRRGYTCNYFSGRVFMTKERYLRLVNDKTIVK